MLADIHANWEALRAVFEDIVEYNSPDLRVDLGNFLNRGSVARVDNNARDKLVCLGDFVGYGPDMKVLNSVPLFDIVVKFRFLA